MGRLERPIKQRLDRDRLWNSVIAGRAEGELTEDRATTCHLLPDERGILKRVLKALASLKGPLDLPRRDRDR